MRAPFQSCRTVPSDSSNQALMIGAEIRTRGMWPQSQVLKALGFGEQLTMWPDRGTKGPLVVASIEHQFGCTEAQRRWS